MLFCFENPKNTTVGNSLEFVFTAVVMVMVGTVMVIMDRVVVWAILEEF